MQASVVNNFIDNKIRQTLNNNLGIEGVLNMLGERVQSNDGNENCFKAYIAVFSKKRINDINIVRSKFDELSEKKKYTLLNLLKLRDKLVGIPDFEIGKFGQLVPRHIENKF